MFYEELPDSYDANMQDQQNNRDNKHPDSKRKKIKQFFGSIINRNRLPSSDAEEERAPRSHRRSEDIGKYTSDMKRRTSLTQKDQEKQIAEKPGVVGQVNSFMKNIRNIGQGILTNTASFSSQSEY